MSGVIFRSPKAWAKDNKGASVVMFALALPAALALAAFAVTYEQRNAQANAAQTIIDGAALAAVNAFQNNGTAASARAVAANYLTAGAASVGDIVTNSTVTANDTTDTVTISYSSTTPLQIGSQLLKGSLPINVNSSAKLSTTYAQTPVCILITDYDAGHTLKTAGTAQLHVNNCMVQVNTNDWDAVQADGSSYIHIDTPNQDGNWNCYVGDIHFGDVLPAKQATCTLLPDPYAQMTLPPESDICTDSNNYAINNTTKTFSPGNYCGKISITGSSTVTFQPGIYYFSGPGATLSIGGTSNVTANGVVFVLTNAATDTVMAAAPSPNDATAPNGPKAKAGPAPKKNAPKSAGIAQLVITTSGTVTMSPYTGNDYAPLQGFVIFQDPSIFSDWTCSCGQQVGFSNATLNTSGTIYLVDDILKTTNVNWTHKGALVADMLHPEGSSKVTINGDPQSALTKGTVPQQQATLQN